MIVNLDAQPEADSRLSSNPWYNDCDVLDDPRAMLLVPGTCDTYKCNDCNIVLSGYKRGDPGLSDHIRSGGGQCRYIRAK